MILREDTAATVNLGPFLDKTDGVTPETALAPTVRVSKNGGAWANRDSGSAIAHSENGWYSVPLSAVDTDTAGRLLLSVTDAATHLPVWQVVTVLPASAYDALVAGSGGSLANLDAAVSSRSSHGAPDLSNLDAAVSSRASTAALTQAVIDILAAVATRLATSGYTSPPSAAAIKSAVWDALTADHDESGSMGEALTSAGGAADPLLNEVPGDYPSRSAGQVLGSLIGAEVTMTSPVAETGDVELQVGDSYLAADGRALEWSDNGSWPDLSGIGTTALFIAGSFEKEVTIVGAGTASQGFELELTSAETSELGVGSYTYVIKVDDQWTLVRGSLDLRGTT